MKTVNVSCALLALLGIASADTPSKKTTKAKKQAVSLTAAEIKWGPAPSVLPKGAELGVLYGDPTKPGPFTIRIKMPDGYKVGPHWHSQDEQLTVLGGTLNLYMGDDMTSPHALDVGSFHYLPGKMHHAASAKGDVIVQIQGTGPFDIHYLDPADNPVPKSAKR